MQTDIFLRYTTATMQNLESALSKAQIALGHLRQVQPADNYEYYLDQLVQLHEAALKIERIAPEFEEDAMTFGIAVQEAAKQAAEDEDE